MMRKRQPFYDHAPKFKRRPIVRSLDNRNVQGLGITRNDHVHGSDMIAVKRVKPENNLPWWARD